MDGFIDKLAGFLRDLMGNGGSAPRAKSTGSAGYQDPDLREAWEELDDYMRGGTGERKQQSRRQGGTQESRGSRPPVDESLRADYANLEVPFGSDIETVRNSYKTLMLRYHPDKHAGNPEKQRIALEITKKVNQSFERIRSRHENGVR